MKSSDSYLILEELMQKRLLAIKPDQLGTWLDNLENTGQITKQENNDLFTLAEHLDIYTTPLTEYTFLRLRTDLYLHPSMLSSFFDTFSMWFFIGYLHDFYGSAANGWLSTVASVFMVSPV